MTVVECASVCVFSVAALVIVALWRLAFAERDRAVGFSDAEVSAVLDARRPLEGFVEVGMEPLHDTTVLPSAFTGAVEPSEPATRGMGAAFVIEHERRIASNQARYEFMRARLRDPLMDGSGVGSLGDAARRVAETPRADEWLAAPDTLYDTVVLTPGALPSGEVPFFTLPIGAAVVSWEGSTDPGAWLRSGRWATRTKTQRETNMLLSARLANDERFRVEAIGLTCPDAERAGESVAELVRYWGAQGAHLCLSVAGDEAVMIPLESFGRSAPPLGRVDLARPIMLERVCFSVKMSRFPGVTERRSLLCYLAGTRWTRRP